MEAAMKVSKWGGSLAVRLPKELVEKLNIAVGDDITLTQVGESAFKISKRKSIEEFRQAMSKFNWEVPLGYKFDREEANER
jgi:antitoxin MazE